MMEQHELVVVVPLLLEQLVHLLLDQLDLDLLDLGLLVD
jgi:hypothetical protein